jgi:colanic acid/amylovoran biosynthesis glycosyltransferase
VRLAYLCNLYPAVSHSFVRREIEAVERAGHEVHRFSLRSARGDLKDEADLREAERTEAVLAQGVGRLLISALMLCLSRPIKSAAALAAAWRLGRAGLAPKARHAAYWLEAAWLVRRLERLGVEHVHAHFGTNPAAVALLVKAFGGPPFSFTVHGPDEFDAPVALSLGAKIEASSFVAAISSYGRSQLMRWSAPDEWEKIQLIRCGLDRDFLEAPTEDIPEGSTEFVCVARLSAQKGLPLLVAACDRLRAAGERFTITIIGDGELRDTLEADIRRRKLDDCIRLAGVRTSSEIREHLRGGRAFVLPSFAEGLPVVLMEALALSRPVIATAIAGIPELVDAECGWLIPAGSEQALARAMAEALHLPANELVAKGTTGRDRVRDMHDADRNAAQMINAIARGPAMSLILDNMEATAEPVDAIAQYPNEMGKAAVDIKARCKPGVGRGNA